MKDFLHRNHRVCKALRHGDNAQQRGCRKCKLRLKEIFSYRQNMPEKNRCVRNGVEYRNIKHTLMSFTVITNNSRTVNPDYEVKLSESRIMQKLVIGSLEKC